MEIQNIDVSKLNLITWISQLQDASLIEKLQNFQEDTIQIPQWQKDIVRERIRKSEENPERLLYWNDVKDGFILD